MTYFNNWLNAGKLFALNEGAPNSYEWGLGAGEIPGGGYSADKIYDNPNKISMGCCTHCANISRRELEYGAWGWRHIVIGMARGANQESFEGPHPYRQQSDQNTPSASFHRLACPQALIVIVNP